jgi:hypothetical protein
VVIQAGLMRGGETMRTRLVVLACTLIAIVASAAPASAGTPEVVVGTDREEFEPAASSTYLAWTELRIRERRVRSNVYFRTLGTDERIQVNPAGTFATAGGIDGTTLAYDRDGDIFLYDLATRTELDVPDGVNTRRGFEYSASISGTHLLFVRSRGDQNSIVLFDMVSGSDTVLYSKANNDRRFFILYAGQVNGNYAVWQQDVGSVRTGDLVDADVWIHDIAGDATDKVAKPEGTLQYAPSVSADGTMYFGRSGFGCGLDVLLVQRDVGGGESTLYEFPDGRDFLSSVAADTGATTDVYFDRGRCRGAPNQDIVRISAA